jgi:hypothetical protein
MRFPDALDAKAIPVPSVMGRRVASQTLEMEIKMRRVGK